MDKREREGKTKEFFFVVFQTPYKNVASCHFVLAGKYVDWKICGLENMWIDENRWKKVNRRKAAMI